MDMRTILAVAVATISLASEAATVTYVHTDVLGSPIVETDVAGHKLAGEVDYRAYGEEVLRLPQSGTGFTGHYRDASTDLVYMQQRYYDPGIGRFLSADPVESSKGDLRHFNRYAYAYSNPYRFTDPDGRCPACVPIIFGIGLMTTSEPANAPALGEEPVSTPIGEQITSALPPGKALAPIKMAARAGDRAKTPQADANRAASRTKGVPDSQIGPSGKPKVHTVEHSTRKGAKDAAEKEAPAGGGARFDAHPQDGQKAHFQAENAQGANVKPVVHHCPPGKSC